MVDRVLLPDQIEAVLLHDGWHSVFAGSFHLGAFFIEGERADDVSLDFYFDDCGGTIFGRLSSVLAVRTAA